MNCQKCNFYKPGNYAQTGTCIKYVAYRGRGRLVYEFSSSVRADKNKCGPSARFFIPKDPEKNVQIDSYRILKSLLEDGE